MKKTLLLTTIMALALFLFACTPQVPEPPAAPSTKATEAGEESSASQSPSATAAVTATAAASETITADITKAAFDSLCEPLAIIADMKCFKDYEYAADSQISNENATYFLIEYVSYCMSGMGRDYSAEGVDTEEFGECIKLSKEEVAALMQSVFGPEAFDINQYTPDTGINNVIENSGNYYISIAEPGNSQVTYNGEVPLPYSIDTAYIYDLIPPYDDESEMLSVSMRVNLVRDENSKYGYHIGSVAYDKPF